MEILAPAGNALNFYAAIESGADAVYLGAPGLNARNLSRDLSLEEIAAMIDFAHSRDKRVYLAVNSLILEKELPDLVRMLAVFERLQPDALIVQDLAVIDLVASYFPSLPLHASTLMGASHSGAVSLFRKMGCRRVVLARELTLKEIAGIRKTAAPELEVFVHGAMCYSFSGMCLFSSYLGGKSGLRGRCVQPCRRAYSRGALGKGRSASNRTGSGNGSYLFSMNDLCGLRQIEELKQIGVASIKIEGRMRSANYVRQVVTAYRLVVDNPGEDALRDAENLILQAMGRKTSSGYFLSPAPQDVIVPFHSGNMGLHIGSFTTITRNRIGTIGKIRIKQNLQAGDRLRLHNENSGERKAFTLASLHIDGQEATSAVEGQVIQLLLPETGENPGKGRVDLYKVDTGDGPEEKLPPSHHRACDRQRSRIASLASEARKQTEGLCRELVYAGGSDKPKGDSNRSGRGMKGRRHNDIPLWLKLDSFSPLLNRLPFKPDIFVFRVEKGLLAQSGKIKSYFGRNIRSVLWELPPLLFERDAERLKKQIHSLIRTGFRNFQLTHIGQRELFGNEKVSLYGGATLNLANSSGLMMLQREGFRGGQVSMELDREAFAAVARGFTHSAGSGVGESMLLGFTAYGLPALFTSRLNASFFEYRKPIISPKNESFTLKREDGAVLALPERPFSLLPYLADFREMGYEYAVLDLCRMNAGEKDIRDLGERLRPGARMPRLSSFNYCGSLE